jgi:protein ImuB
VCSIAGRDWGWHGLAWIYIRVAAWPAALCTDDHQCAKTTSSNMVGSKYIGGGEARMSVQANAADLFACVHVTEFPAQALLRLHTNLQSEPVAVLEGRAPEEFVCAMNRHALRKGAALGMTRLDAEGIGELRLFARSTETEVAARVVLLECISRFSPRIQECSYRTACAFVLDISGMERLFGSPAELAKRLRSVLASSGFRAWIAVSMNYETARIKASACSGIAIIPEGKEAAGLAKLPVSLLRLGDERHETFATWGIRTLGELAALPKVELISRLGADAQSWHELAHGIHPHMFQPIEPDFALREYCDFETPVEEMDSLLFIGARMIDCLVARATDRALSLAWLTVHMRLAGGHTHQRVLRPAIPSNDRKFLLKLLQLEIAAHPPQAAVIALELTAEAGRSHTVQLGLFSPQTPEPSRLDVTLSRLRAIVGDDRVGSPVLEDTHRGGSFRMEGFGVRTSAFVQTADAPRTALRRVRPPMPLSVLQRAATPEEFRDAERRFTIVAAYGPWKSSGCWWSTDAWNREEWDILAESSDGSSIACILVYDRARNEWQLEAYYD